MGKDFGLYGPWVRHDWCPRCFRRTEQSRWHRRRLGEPPEHGELRVRCHECSSDVVRPRG